MKLPSIHYLYTQAKNSAMRFPVTLLASLLGVIISIYLVENEGENEQLLPLINLTLCAGLGIPLFFCLKVFSEKVKLPPAKSIALTIFGAVLLVLLYFTFPSSEETANTSVPYIRYTIYNIALHLLVSFAPFIKGRQLNGFWQYNRHLFTRIILSVIYSGVLYVGIVLAMGSLDLLFDVKIRGERYFEVFIIISGFFNTWFFISGMPDNFDELDELDYYPFGLKVFSQYILLPLLLLYLFILYAYGAKIVMLWDWPKGIVSWLIVAVSVLGILTFLLIHPYGQKEENSWIRKFTKAYYFIVVPLVGMLFMAISMRVADYGITINRYIIILLGVWLTLLCAYFIIGKNNIKFIPISLCVMILLMSFGPWSMFSVSERSQAARLESLLTDYGLLKDGKIVNEQILVIDSNFYSQQVEYPNQMLMNDSLCNEVKSILDYMDDFHGFNSIKSWYSEDYAAQLEAYNLSTKRWNRINEAEVYMKALGLEYRYYYTNYENTYFSYSTSYHQQVSEIKGYDYLVDINYYYYYESNTNNNAIQFTIDSIPYTLMRTDKDHYYFNVYQDKESILSMDIDQLKDKLIQKYGSNYQNELPHTEMRITGEQNGIHYRLELQNMNFRTENGKTSIESINGKLLLRFEPGSPIEKSMEEH
ncbi:MAG: DUF4153 domain-containing protein [Flavobacteriales bacterium]|nr:DUF4153 domain-containing protein [Flavobacteriales bacterium]